MSKYINLLLIIQLSLGAPVSWGKSADQLGSAQSRLTQSLGNTQKTATKTPAKMPEKKKNEVPELPSISSLVPGFFMPPASIHGDGNGNGNSDASGSLGLGDTSGNSGNQNSNNSGSATSGRIVSDESAKAEDPNAGGDGSGNKKQLPPIAPPTIPQTAGSGAVKGSGQQFQKWWPICAFVDKSMPDDEANKVLKGVVDRAAQDCQVKIELFAIKTDWAPYGDNDVAINKASVEKCNLPNGLPGSATALVPSEIAAAKMCNSKKDIPEPPYWEWNKSTAGCAELRSGTKVDEQAHQAAMPSGEAHSDKVGGNVAASIEVPLGWNTMVVSHEAIGHSQMGKPNGSRYGMGIGENEDFDSSIPGTRGGKMDPTWSTVGSLGSPSGCQVMRDQALNMSEAVKLTGSSQPLLYDRNRQTYMSPTSKLYDMSADPPLFSPPNPVPPPGPISTPMIAQTVPGVSRSQGQASNLDSGFFDKADGKIYGNSVPEAKVAAASPEKHKEGQTKIPTAAKAAPKSQPKLIGESQPVQEPRADVNIAITPPAGGELAKKGNKVVWAEGAKAVDPKDFAGKGNADVSSDNVYNSSSSSTSVAGGSSTKGGSILYDEGASVNPYAGTQDSGPNARPAGAAPNSYSDSNSLALGGYSGSGGNSSSGGKVGAGSGFDSGVFNGLGEEETEEEAAYRRKKSGATTERNGRRPASGSESRGVRVSKPTYGESE
jgi:hypothetical protein